MLRKNTIPVASTFRLPGILLGLVFLFLSSSLSARQPADIIINCGEDYTDLNLTGRMEGDYQDELFLNDCGIGYVIRKWKTGGQSVASTQRIDIVNQSPFKAEDISWPQHLEQSVCASKLLPEHLPESYARPKMTNNSCSRISVNYTDELQRDAAGKLQRKWTIIDWCQYDPEQKGTKGYFEYIQLINVHTSKPPAFSSTPTEQLFCSNKGDCGATHITLVTSAMDDCTPASHLIYSFKIDLDSDGVVDRKGEGADASGTFPLGKHHIDWFVTDGCGNISTSSYEFSIRDCQQPKAYCLNGTSVTLEPSSGMTVRVWASELDLSSMDNCGIAELRIATPSGGPGQTIPPPAADFVEFDCRQLGMHSVDVWVMDEGKNWDYCTTYLHISDSRKACKEDQADADASLSPQKKTTEIDDLQLIESVIITEKVVEEEKFKLYQNHPNPFLNETNIRFYLPNTCNARLSIFDAKGKVLRTIEKSYTAGLHNIQLKKSGLTGHHVLYYQLDTDKDTKSMMMILID